MLVQSRYLLMAVMVSLIPFYDKTSFSVCTLEDKFVRISGDFIVGALFAVHEKPDIYDVEDSSACGPIGENFGIQRVEAALLAIDQINNNSTILPNITLGIEIRDTCGYFLPIALYQTIQLVRNLTPRDVDDSGKIYDSSEENFPLIAVVGPPDSECAMQVQNILQKFRISQLGYAATSSDLEHHPYFPYYFSLLPLDYNEICTMALILQEYKWSCVSIVYSRGSLKAKKTLLFLKLIFV